VCVCVCVCVHMHPQVFPSYQHYSVQRVAFRCSASYLVSSRCSWTVRAEDSRVRRCHVLSLRAFVAYERMKSTCFLLLWILSRIPSLVRASVTRNGAVLLYCFFWVILRRLNFICRRFGILCPIFIGVISRKNTAKV
jgi:hypothetical protein